METPDECFITYIPAENVAKIEKPSAIISIKGKYNDRPDIPEMHVVHKLDFDVGSWAVECDAGLRPEQIDPLIEFVNAHPDKDVYVHCTEGRIRSYTIAQLLYRKVDRYVEVMELTGPGRVMDRSTQRTWMEHFNSKVT